MLALTAAALRAVPRCCCSSRVGYYWQAIRENQEAAQALGINTFRYKMLAVVLSRGDDRRSAGVFFAFYYNNLFPEQVFHICARSSSSSARSSAASARCSGRSSARSC